MNRVATFLFASFVGFALTAIAPAAARAEACAETADVAVTLSPATSCLTITDGPNCDGGASLRITNGCAEHLIGVEHRSSTIDKAPGTPPLRACVFPWTQAKEAGEAPPPCVLAAGEVGWADVWPGDELDFELGGHDLTATVAAENVSEEGCSMSGGRGGSRLSALGVLAVAAAIGLRRARGARRRSPAR